MKHRIAMRLLLFCALTFGIGNLAQPGAATASPNQVHVGVGVAVHPIAHHRHHRRRRRHHKVAVGVGVHIN